ncbi:hypothetical protein [Streptomyces sp. NPDC049040]|uniref:hypothetical protein n=1 Tax=Streptomyces sp. NPDC049040 TaxID=3365593 RepID=UPI00371506B7
MTLTTPPGPGSTAAPASPTASPPVSPTAALAGQAAAAGLRVLAAAHWPESPADRVPPPLAGFVVSSFSPLAAEAARRCLTRRPDPAEAAPDAAGAGTTRTAVIVVSALGDLAGAVHVAEAIEGGGRPGPLMFFQAVPNAVAGYVAARWGLTGPVVCVGDTAAGLGVAATLLEDGDAEDALLIRVDQAATAAAHDRAGAVLLGPREREGERL